jgi:hypothetical protein
MLSRRQWMKLSAAGVVAHSLSGWIETLAADAAASPARKRACILLWMTGGPSQIDTFDLKTGHANGGPYKPIETSVPGITISEHLPKIAREMGDLAIVRSMSTKEGDHGRATYHLRTGYMPTGPIQYPALGSLVAKEFERDDAELPNFVSVAPFRFFNQAAYGPGFLGPQYAPLVVGEQGVGQVQGQGGPSLKVEDLDSPPGVSRTQEDSRLGLLEGLDGDFASRHPGLTPVSHRMAYQRAVRMMRSAAVKAFDLDGEDPKLRDAYGRSPFGQGCLLARRLIERGVPFVEVTLANVPGQTMSFAWDTHFQNFDAVKKLCEVLDSGWSTLMRDLRARGLLDSTLVVWMGEFGRTPKINQQQGRDHFPNAWTTVLGGGGIKGGQVIGKTSPDGTSVVERPVSVPDFLATTCLALGIDPLKQNMSDIGRPIRIVDLKAQPIREVLA